jgi:hypothetical protein
MRKTSAILAFLALFLFACNSARTTPQVTSVLETSQSLPTAVLTNTPVPPTATLPPTATASPTVTSTPTATPPQDYGPTNFPNDVNPLTGLRVEDPAVLDRRPVAVKIQSFPRQQRPDWGISQADIIYDYYQNNGLTRLNAIFYGMDNEKAGPVRSARLFDSHIIRMYEAIFAFGGADQRILNRLFNSEYADRLVVEGSTSCTEAYPALCREDPNGYNYLIANPKAIGPYVESKGGDNSRQKLEGTTFKHQTPEGGQPGENAYVRYSISAYVNWKYDPVTGKYLRFQDKVEAYTPQEEAYEPVTDRLDEKQVAADNVIILKVIHEYAYKSGNSEIVDILLGGSGEAYAFRDGKVYQLQWNRPTNAMLTLTFPDGTPYPLKPGTTWYQVIGQSSTNELTGDNGMRFEFRIP